MADGIKPITLEEEEEKRKRLKIQIENIENQYQDLYGDIWGDKDKQWEVTTTIEEDLESAFKPFSDSGQYNQKELDIIKTHLSNKLKKERASRGMTGETSDLNYYGGKAGLRKDLNEIAFGSRVSRLRVSKRLSNFYDQLKIGENKGYLELNQDFVLNTSLYSKVVPSNSPKKISLYDNHIFEILDKDSYKLALQNRVQDENKQSNKLNYIRIYDNDIFGLEQSNEYVEIDSVRRSIDENGNFKYEIYNILNNKDNDGNPIVGENLKLANEDQVKNFKDKLFNYEYDVEVTNALIENNPLEDPNLTAGGNDHIQASISQDVRNGKVETASISSTTNTDNIPKEDLFDQVIKNSDVKEEDHEETRVLLEKAFKIEHGNGKDRIVLRKLPKLEEVIYDEIKRKGVNITVEDLYKSIDNIDFAVMFNFKDGVRLPIYGDIGDEYTIEDYEGQIMNLKTLNVVDQMKEIANKTRDTLIETSKSLESKYKKEIDDYVDKNHVDVYFDFYQPHEKGGAFRLIDSSKENREKISKLYKDLGISLTLDDFTKFVDQDNKVLGYGVDAVYIAALYSAEMDKVIAKDKDYMATEAKVLKNQEKLLENIKAEAKPEYHLLDKTTLSFIDEKLKSSGFHSADTYTQKLILDNIWDAIEEFVLLKNPIIADTPDTYSEHVASQRGRTDLRNKYKNEFYFMMFHEHLAYTKDPKGQNTEEWSVFALKDFCRNLVSVDVHDIAGMKDRAGYLSNTRYKWRIIEDFALDIIKADEDLLLGKDGTLESFIKGFTKNKLYEYLPFAGSIVGINDARFHKGAANRIYGKQKYELALQRKKSGVSLEDDDKPWGKEDEKLLNKYKNFKNPTEADNLMMSLYSLNNMVKSKTKDNSAYNTGGIIADMLPYIPEFFMTSGAFTGTKTTVQGWMKGAGFTGKWSSRFASTFSWLLGTGAQAAANPQHYVKYTLENMTAPMKIAFIEHDYEENSIFSVINKNTIENETFGEYKEGEEYTALNGKKFKFRAVWDEEMGDPMLLGEAFFRAYGITWAEMGTERLGETFPGLIRYLTPNQARGWRRYTESVILGKFMKTERYTKWVNKYTKFDPNSRKALNIFFAKNAIGWNGILGEVMEETINQPISSLIMGRRWDEAFVDENGNFDPTFLKEMTSAIGITQGIFTGKNIIQVHRKRKKKRK